MRSKYRALAGQTLQIVFTLGAAHYGRTPWQNLWQEEHKLAWDAAFDLSLWCFNAGMYLSFGMSSSHGKLDD